MIELAKGVRIGENELHFQASRSGGPGGQNVNKVNTRITILFDVSSCMHLSREDKSRILNRLRNRATAEGIIHVTCQDYRSQAANRQAAIRRLTELLRGALARHPVRKPTSVPRSARLRRLENKAKRSSLKKLRSAGYLQG